MARTMTAPDFTRMLRAAAARVDAEVATLSRLDSVCGDGDHGTTMKRAIGNAVQAADGAAAGGDLPALVEAVAWAVLGTDGGATCPLFGSVFLGLSEGLRSVQSHDTVGVAAAFEAGLAAVRKQTPAQPGDKTMIDALLPAVEMLRKAASEGADLPAALARAADAAEAAAKATAPMRARLGRARNLGDRSIGSPDPGATSVGLLFRGFADAMQAS
jgi:dihydroxyacetone kinase-like protein